MKRITVIFIAMLFVFTLAACGTQTAQVVSPDDTLPQDIVTPTPTPEPATESETTLEPESEPEPIEPIYSIVATTFPQYDWVRRIIGDRAGYFELTLLLDNQIDLHNYQPSVSDIVKIGTSDMFIYVGGESDDWTDDVLRQAPNQDIVAISLMESLGSSLKLEEILEGMELDDDDDHGHSHSHDDDDDDDDDDEEHYDEHVWLSLRNAVMLSHSITDAISEMDPEYADSYKANLNAYIAELTSLDVEFQKAVNAANIDTLLFASRFPFLYLADDYGLHCYAAFSGCSAETEASFATIVFLTNKVDELNLRSIMVTECSDQSIAKTIINNSSGGDKQILVMNAIQSITANDVSSGVTYLSLMEGNLDVLIEALAN